MEDDITADWLRMLIRVQSAFVFGSAATGKFALGSDIDQILVADSHRCFPDRFRDFEELREISAALDLLVYRPDEFASMDRSNRAPFWSTVRRQRIRIV